MFCKNCGGRLDETTGACARCSAAGAGPAVPNARPRSGFSLKALAIPSLLCLALALGLGYMIARLGAAMRENEDLSERVSEVLAENAMMAEELAELRGAVRDLDFERFQLLSVLSAQFSFDGEAFLRGNPQLIPDQPGTGTTQWHPIRIPEDGILYMVMPGDNMAEIVERFWPIDPRDPDRQRIRNELIAHVAASNNISNPEHLQVGWELLITRHPTIHQP